MLLLLVAGCGRGAGAAIHEPARVLAPPPSRPFWCCCHLRPKLHVLVSSGFGEGSWAAAHTRLSNLSDGLGEWIGNSVEGRRGKRAGRGRAGGTRCRQSGSENLVQSDSQG
ncbi:hypothetical protein IWZ03DRAFT_180921 [Phyllosticta citriasiana]|uniref:Secreted protein n=1 Tax=Phyllosticta citriasiana TaxID=595635 RepID=A0ABR1KMS6_9PEZI